MGKWSQYRHRGGAGTLAPPLPSLTIALDGAADIQWTWALPDPDHWRVETAPAAIGPWTFFSDEGSAARASFGFSPETFIRVQAQAADDSPLSQLSNVVETPP